MFYKKKILDIYAIVGFINTPPPQKKKALGINFKLRKCLSMPMPILDNLEYDPTKKKVGGLYCKR